MPERTTAVRFALALLVCVATAACKPAPGDAMIEQTAARMQKAVDLLESSAGDEKRLVEAAMAWRVQHARELPAAEAELAARQKSLDQAQRLHWNTAARNRWEPLIARMQVAAQHYPRPNEALRYVRPLWGPTGPMGIQGSPWLPEAPALPPELLEPPTESTATAPHP